MEITVDDIETPTMTKAQLAELLFERIGLNKREAKEMVDAFFDLIGSELIKGKDVRIAGFGSFEIRAKAPRPGRNPRTGALVPIEARRVVVFHPSQRLRSLLKGGEIHTESSGSPTSR